MLGKFNGKPIVSIKFDKLVHDSLARLLKLFNENHIILCKLGLECRTIAIIMLILLTTIHIIRLSIDARHYKNFRIVIYGNLSSYCNRREKLFNIH